MTSPSPYLSLVVPAYRQADTICENLSSLHTYLTRIVPSHEIIVVIDGNEDNTLKKITEHCSVPHLRIECFEKNRGKGLALRHGLGLATGILVAFIDAGSDISYESMEVMIALMKLYRADIVIGSKRHSLSEVNYPPIRRLYSFAYQMLNRLLFRLRVRDTQVGLKLFRNGVLKKILPRIVVKYFAFDLELLVVAKRLGFNRVVEAPVHLQYNFTSSIRLHNIFRVLWDTFAVFYRLRFLHWYDEEHEIVSSPKLSPGIVVQSTSIQSKQPARAHAQQESVAP